MKLNHAYKFALKYSWIILLIGIFIFSYYIRAINNVPDRLLSFDPIFQYRFTKYFADWGHLPVWDELSYYTGREVNIGNFPPFMFYLTSALFWLTRSFGFSLMTVASHTSAIYGAMICIAAFLLGRELSNKYGGIMAATLIGTAPQILVRTFGSSYDTDQLVIFFLILTIYLGLYALRRKTIFAISIALIGFIGFMLTWNMFFFTYVVLVINIIVYFILMTLVKRYKDKKTFLEKLSFQFREIKYEIIILIVIFLCLAVTNLITSNFSFKYTIIDAVSALIGFAQRAEAWIVNVSIAELQPFSIFNFDGWVMSMGSFVTGYDIIDIFLILLFFAAMIIGFIYSYKKDINSLSFLLTLFLVAIVITFRGIRFTEFSSAFFIILIAVGFGNLIEWSKKDKFLKSFSLGLLIFVIIVSVGLGIQMGERVGPDISQNWDNAWTFLRTETPELSLVGTWWDPGHMITGLAERRVVADGAHCANDCLYTINDRITDLGKIMVTNDENESLRLIRKDQGDSPNIYWIASDDLIGKFQWLQYFGIGCDARSDRSCPLYMQLPEQSRSTDSAGNIVLRKYGNVILYTSGDIPIPIYTEGINALLFDEIIIYNGTEPVPIKFSNEEKNILIEGLKPLEKQLNIRFNNQSISMTVWIPSHYSFITIIPPNLRESVFTKMFMLEGQGLEHFKQVFRNEQVKIYEVI